MAPRVSDMWVGENRICVTESCGVNPLFLQCKPPNVSDMWVGRTPNLRYGIVRCESFVLAVQATKRLRYVGGANTESALRNRAV